MAYQILEALPQHGSLEIEQRNQDLLIIGKQAGEAIVTLLPLIHRVTNNWYSYFPFGENVDAALQKAIQDMGNYCQFFHPPDQFRNQQDDLSHLTHVVSLNLNPKPLEWQGKPYIDQDRPNRLRRFLGEYAELLTETFTLPAVTDDNVEYLLNSPLEKRLEWAGAPAGLEGLRFLPSYRRLNWRQTDEKAGELSIVHKPHVPLDIMQFKKKGGREFFLTSTGGINGFDLFLEEARRHEPIAIVGAIKDVSPLRIRQPAVVVDKDSTVTYEDWWKSDSDAVKAARETFFRELSQRNIPVLMWSRNWSVHAFREDLIESLGINILPAIDFENWPFFQQGGTKLAFDPAILQASINTIPIELQEAIARYVQENFNEEIGHPFSYYAEVLRTRIADFMESHFAIWRGKEFGDWDEKSQSDLARENILEAKVPLFAGLSQNEFPIDIRAGFINDGILVNDREFSLESMKIFGYGFIHVDWVPQVDRAADIIALAK